MPHPIWQICCWGPSRWPVPYRHLLLPWVLITFGGIVAAVAHLIPVWLCLLPLLVNLVITFRIDVKLSEDVAALLYCGRLLTVANRMARLGRGDSLSELGRLEAELPLRRKLGRQISGLNCSTGCGPRNSSADRS